MAGKKKNMLLQGGILAGAGLITKVIGFAYRIPMNNMLGDEGNGLYSVAFGIYGIALTISTFSLPLAVSKLISARAAKGEGRNAQRVVVNSMLYALTAGLLIMFALYFGSGVLEDIYRKPGLALPLRILAPTTFIVALLGVFRGYFQGFGDMVPTSASQIVEQIVNAVVSVLAAWQFMKIYADTEQAAAYGAAGGTLGTLSGAAAALVFMFILFLFTHANYRLRRNRQERPESNAFILRALFLTIIPVILSQTVFQIGYTIDDIMFGHLMVLHDYEDKVITSLQGVFNTQYNQLINLPVSIATSMAASVLPSIVLSKTQGDMYGVHQKITQVIKVNMVIAFPSAIGMAVLAKPIMQILFPSLVTYRPQAVILLTAGSSAVIFYALSALTTSILQGNNNMRKPVIHSAISLGIHVVLLGLLLVFTNLNVYALVICNILFPVVISVLNCRLITLEMDYQWEIQDIFLKPLISSVMMGIVAFVVYRVLFQATKNLYIAAAAAITLSVIVYSVTILQLGCFNEEDLGSIPGGHKLRRFL